jgi:integrase
VLVPAIAEANRVRAERGLRPLPEVTMHDLRRTCVALLFEAGATVPYVMKQVGHTDPKVTLSIYAEVLRRSPEVGERVDALLQDARPPATISA